MNANGTLLIGYNVEKTNSCSEFLKKAIDIHEQFDAPFTVFALGSCIAAEPAIFERVASNPLVDMAQHTWSHVLLKTVVMEQDGETDVIRAANLEQIENEVARARDAVEAVCGVPCIGITGPWSYYRGLADRPEILEVLHNQGIRYLRTYGRNERDAQPVSLDLQPFWYAAQGFGDMLECNVNGWKDTYLRSHLGWNDVKGFVDVMKSDLEYASERDLVFSWESHDWSSLRNDSKLSIIKEILKKARSLKMQLLHYRHYYTRQEALRNPEVLAA